MKRREFLVGTAATIGAAMIVKSRPTYAQQMDAAKKWVDNEFQPSTLSKDEQMAEMDWFIKASKPFQGTTVNMASETITTHAYEANRHHGQP